jgi:hypothetical protein
MAAYKVGATVTTRNTAETGGGGDSERARTRQELIE